MTRPLVADDPRETASPIVGIYNPVRVNETGVLLGRRAPGQRRVLNYTLQSIILHHSSYVSPVSPFFLNVLKYCMSLQWL